ncbi:MAG TPA: hypothetical protein VH092_25675 [Urbifossiella sp.]|jgi:hypothetical protein|nr:hypothetical protein [Urbifossiella sp.]
MTDPDDLESLLVPRPAPAPRPDFDAALLARTERALARGRRARQLSRAAAVAAVFAAGGLAGWVVKPAPPERLVPAPAQIEVVTVPVVVPVPVAASDPGPVAASDPEPATAAAAELLAEQADDPARAARLYQLAGDKYLLDAQDFRNAGRCYRLFLTRAGDGGLSPTPADSWLLVELKVSLLKERHNAAKNNG